MMERRDHTRTRAFAAGAVRPDRGGPAAGCVVRDLSAGGALLLLEEPGRAPTDLTLAFAGVSRPARVVWRGRGGVGVAFAGEAAPEVASLDAARLARAGDAGRLAARIARFVRPSPRA